MTSKIALAGEDLARLTAAMTFVGTNDTDSVLAAAMPSLGEAERQAVARHAHFAHAALLISPDQSFAVWSWSARGAFRTCSPPTSASPCPALACYA